MKKETATLKKAYKLPTGKVLALKILFPNRKSSRLNFQYPEVGKTVKDPSWRKTKTCGNGLHGYLWGIGNTVVSLYNPSNKHMFQVHEIETYVDLGGKIKYPEAKVVFESASARAAMKFIGRYTPAEALIGAALPFIKQVGRDKVVQVCGDHGEQIGALRVRQIATIYAKQTAINHACQVAGKYATQVAGDFSIQTAEANSKQTAINHACQVAGKYATQVAGDFSIQTAEANSRQTAEASAIQRAGDYSCQIALRYATQVADDNCNLISGDFSTQRAGYNSYLKTGRESRLIVGQNGCFWAGIGSEVIIASHFLEKPFKCTVDGKVVKSQTWYRLERGKLVEVDLADIPDFFKQSRV